MAKSEQKALAFDLNICNANVYKFRGASQEMNKVSHNQNCLKVKDALVKVDSQGIGNLILIISSK